MIVPIYNPNVPFPSSRYLTLFKRIQHSPYRRACIKKYFKYSSELGTTNFNSSACVQCYNIYKLKCSSAIKSAVKFDKQTLNFINV
jgi:hypothetical protein